MRIFVAQTNRTRNIPPHTHSREEQQVRVFVTLDVVVRLHLIVRTQFAPLFPIAQHRGSIASQHRISVCHRLVILTRIEIETCSKSVCSSRSEVEFRLRKVSIVHQLQPFRQILFNVFVELCQRTALISGTRIILHRIRVGKSQFLVCRVGIVSTAKHVRQLEHRISAAQFSLALLRFISLFVGLRRYKFQRSICRCHCRVACIPEFLRHIGHPCFSDVLPSVGLFLKSIHRRPSVVHLFVRVVRIHLEQISWISIGVSRSHEFAHVRRRVQLHAVVRIFIEKVVAARHQTNRCKEKYAEFNLLHGSIVYAEIKDQL